MRCDKLKTIRRHSGNYQKATGSRGIVDRLAKEVEEYKFLRKRRKIKLDKRVWFRIGHDLRIVRAFLVRLKKNAKEAQDNLSRGLRSKEDLSLAAKVR